MIQWKKIILSTIAALGIACFAGGTADAASVKIDEKTFPDVCVRTAVAQYDKNKDGILSDQERDKVTGIDFDSALAQHYTEGHCVDFEGMQNFTDINSIYLDLRYKAKNNSYKYWNYRADNLTQCFPNAQRISIYWYGNQWFSLKNTLTELWSGTLQNTYFWEEINHKQTKPKYQLLDLSKMKKLKRVYACGVASLKTVKLKDTKTKQGIRSLLELHLYGTGIRTLDATAAKNLKRLFVGDRIRKLTVDKCKKLKEIGVINLGSKQAATIKSSSVQHIQYQGKTLKKLSFSKCPKLYTLSIKCTKVGTVNLRSNKRLHYMTLNSKKTGKVVYPKVSTKGWHDCCDLVETNYYKNLDEFKNDPDAKGVYKEYVGYILEYPTKILDISAWTSFNKTVKRCMFGYGDFDHEKCATKKIIINKKLRKADKKWIKKFAKKWHVKVVEK